MQVILFIGEDYYPRVYLRDMVGVFETVPTDAEISELGQRRHTAPDSECLFDPGWATAMVVDGNSAPVLHHWEFLEEKSREALEANGCDHCWQGRNGGWFGVKKHFEEN